MSEDFSHQSTDTEASLETLDDLVKFNNCKNIKNKTKKISLIKKLDLFDKNISNHIHSLELNAEFEYIVYIFARLFNPDMMSIFYMFVFLYHAIIHKNYYFIIKPAIHIFSVLILSDILKAFFKRPRPEINLNVKRLFNLRKKEKNFSMPSGDSIQAANFAIIAMFYFKVSFLGFLVIPFVMFARIFYFCHYFFDTLVGALVGGGVSLAIAFLLRKLNF